MFLKLIRKIVAGLERLLFDPEEWISTIKLDKARLCLDCDTLHDRSACPICGSRAWERVSAWIGGDEEAA